MFISLKSLYDRPKNHCKCPNNDNEKRNIKETYYDDPRKKIEDIIALITTIFGHPISNMNVV